MAAANMTNRRGLVDGLLFLGLGAGCLAEGYRLYATRDLRALPQELWPGLYILLLGAALLVAGAGHLAWNARARVVAAVDPDGSAFARVAQAVAALVVYALLIPQIGYAAASFLFFMIVCTIFGIRSWPLKTALSAAFTAAFFVLFAHYLGVAFPRGALIERFL